MLQIDSLAKSFDGVVACKDVYLRLEPNQVLIVRGRNGSGKSTLINLIAGSLRPDHGKIFVDDFDVTARGAVERARAGIGRSFQWPHTIPEWTVEECIAFSASTRSYRGRGGDWNALVTEVAGLGEHRHVRASALSASHHKLLDLAMTVSREPKVLLLDEPCATLPPTTVPTVVRVLEWACAAWHPAILVVEHRCELLLWASEAPCCTIREMQSGVLLEANEHPEAN